MKKMTNQEFTDLKALFTNEIKTIGGNGKRYERVESVSKKDLAKLITFMLNNGFTVIEEPNGDAYNKQMRYGFIAVSYAERQTREIAVEIRKWHKEETYTVSYSCVMAHPRNKWEKVKPEFTWYLHNIL